jgi:ABC-type branched-subunit amino acid transport system permease subunit
MGLQRMVSRNEQNHDLRLRSIDLGVVMNLIVAMVLGGLLMFFGVLTGAAITKPRDEKNQ